ncbi:MAG: rubrerythrin family protein [Ruminococcaceae bacterium]|nr:rubrerythrin family protein [Oscillospiraceae bacterium]
MVEFCNSETKKNLMRAFAGESQARNRYTFAASQAKKQGMEAIEQVFIFTAGQEKEHAEIFYNHLSAFSGENIHVDGGYPVDISQSVSQLLRYAERNEYEEYNDVYKAFGDKAKEEGFIAIANSFYLISEIEKTHGDRFAQLADMLENNSLYVSSVECKWMCLNCGHIYSGTTVPEQCPVCHHSKGYFIHLTLAPYTQSN